MEQRISMIALGVSDLQRARQFYETGLGWRVSKSGGDKIIFFQLQEMVLGLYPRHLLAEDANLSETGSGFGGITIAYNARDKKEVEQILNQAQNAGATILKTAQNVFWGGYSGYFTDLDSHLWEVVWNPHWKLGEDGCLKLPD